MGNPLALRSKLITLAKGTQNVPVISVPGTSRITFQRIGEVTTIKPSSTLNGNSQLGYTIILSDTNVASISVTKVVPGSTDVTDGTTAFLSDTAVSTTSVAYAGFEFEIRPKANYISDLNAVVTIIGNETGGSVSIPITNKRMEYGN